MLSFQKIFYKKLSNNINHRKVRDHCHYTGNYRSPSHSTCNLKFKVPNEIPVGFHNGSNEFEGQFQCIGENIEIYFPIRMEVIKTKQYSKKSIETISYKIKFIDSMQFMASSPSNHPERIHKLNVKTVVIFLNMKT